MCSAERIFRWWSDCLRDPFELFRHVEQVASPADTTLTAAPSIVMTVAAVATPLRVYFPAIVNRYWGRPRMLSFQSAPSCLDNRTIHSGSVNGSSRRCPASTTPRQCVHAHMSSHRPQRLNGKAHDVWGRFWAPLSHPRSHQTPGHNFTYPTLATTGTI